VRAAEAVAATVAVLVLLGGARREKMQDICEEMFIRNVGFLTESEQDAIGRSTVAIAGMGGVGGLLAERLARLGVGQMKITDPGDFEHSNSSLTSIRKSG
jgi:tRNA A37 threonylcarbamoyladenosine dehydratase